MWPHLEHNLKIPWTLQLQHCMSPHLEQCQGPGDHTKGERLACLDKSNSTISPHFLDNKAQQQCHGFSADGVHTCSAHKDAMLTHTWKIMRASLRTFSSLSSDVLPTTLLTYCSSYTSPRPCIQASHIGIQASHIALHSGPAFTYCQALHSHIAPHTPLQALHSGQCSVLSVLTLLFRKHGVLALAGCIRTILTHPVSLSSTGPYCAFFHPAHTHYV